jgi:hypothetical protein
MEHAFAWSSCHHLDLNTTASPSPLGATALLASCGLGRSKQFGPDDPGATSNNTKAEGAW